MSDRREITLTCDPRYVAVTAPDFKAGGIAQTEVDLTDLTTIRPERINELLCTVPSQRTWWGSAEGALQQQLKQLKNSMNLRLKTASNEIRNSWNEATNGKRTESAIAEMAAQDKEYIELMAQIEIVEANALLAAHVKDSLSEVNKNLQTLSANMRESAEASLSQVPVIRLPGPGGVVEKPQAPRPAQPGPAPVPPYSAPRPQGVPVTRPMRPVSRPPRPTDSSR